MSNKIIQGMKEALTFAKCDHEWQTGKILAQDNPDRIVEYCWKCGCRQTRFENANQ